MQISTGGCSFSTGRCSLSTGRRGFSTGKCKLSTGSSVFYRKLPVEVWDGPKSILKGDLAAKDRFGCMHATVGTLAHCYTLLHHPCRHATKIPAPAKQIDEFSREKPFVKEKQALRAHTTSISGSGNVIKRPYPSSCSMHPRRQNCYKASRGNPVIVKPARVDTIHSTAICNKMRAHATRASTPSSEA